MMNLSNLCSFRHCKDWGLLVLRIAIGVIFIMHGYGKLFGDQPGMDGFIQMVAGLGFPAPVLFAYLSALTEFVGGILVLLGVCTRAFGLLLAINMFVAFTMVKMSSFPRGDVDFALMCIALALALMGAGKFSVMGMMGKEDCMDGCCKMEGGKKK